MITKKRLMEVLYYDPHTGYFFWKDSIGRKQMTTPAGTKQSAGYISISVDGGQYLAHRLAYLYMVGKFPPHQIDHRDGNKHNNRWFNLRPVTNGENGHYRPKTKANKSGYVGVWYNSKRDNYEASISINGIKHNLGRYKTAEEASEAYQKVAKELYE